MSTAPRVPPEPPSSPGRSTSCAASTRTRCSRRGRPHRRLDLRVVHPAGQADDRRTQRRRAGGVRRRAITSSTRASPTSRPRDVAYDPVTNPLGGAEWEYLGANLAPQGQRRSRAARPGPRPRTGSAVGFVGAVTDDCRPGHPRRHRGPDDQGTVTAVNAGRRSAGRRRRHHRAARARGCAATTAQDRRPTRPRLRRHRQRRQPRRRRDRLRPHPPRVQLRVPRAGVDRRDGPSRAPGRVGRPIRQQPQPAGVHRGRRRRGAPRPTRRSCR